jgi:hypothetical protein
MKIDLKPNETVLKAGNTSFSSMGTHARGKLILTNQRIYFKRNNDLTADPGLEILPSQITGVEFFNTWFVFPNGMKFNTSDGQELCFTIKDRDNWSRMINKMC